MIKFNIFPSLYKQKPGGIPDKKAPFRAPTNIRSTCRFDYNPSLCKDYHDTGN